LTDSAKEPHPIFEDDVVYPDAIPFIVFHLACLGAFWSGVTPAAIGICIGLYALRMFAVTAGYHRYFSHRTFKTSRVGQFALAFLCQSSAQRGVIWWAAKHRAHHKYSDTPADPHSPVQTGFWFAHVGWIFAPKAREADYSLVPDLSKYPELRWLDRQKYFPAMVLALIVFLAAGWPGLFIGFFLSTVLLYHGSFSINSLAHLSGKQRYVTGDDSRNSFILALITFGEGWHNNHHHYQSSTRQGFFWWEIDFTYYILKLLSLPRLVWDLKEPPEEVIAGERRLGTAVTRKVAQRLAESFPLDSIARQIRESWAHTPRFEELSRMAREAHSRAEEAFAEWQAHHIPTMDELRERARKMFADTAPIDEIAERARLYIIEALSVRVFDIEPAPATS
jgi:stearoyl-CoA desaturase (delta-9 desaturase)